MHHDYNDIKRMINIEPYWYDDNGVPRYEPFSPDMLPNIYAEACALMHIQCQACGMHFHTSMSASWREIDNIKDTPPRKWHYGDPPAHGCVGDSMNCIDVEVLEAWLRGGKEDAFNWVRTPEYEGVCIDWLSDLIGD